MQENNRANQRPENTIIEKLINNIFFGEHRSFLNIKKIVGKQIGKRPGKPLVKNAAVKLRLEKKTKRTEIYFSFLIAFNKNKTESKQKTPMLFSSRLFITDHEKTGIEIQMSNAQQAEC